MMTKKTFPFEYPSGATPLDPNETEGLIPDYISTQGELNRLEQENILEARAQIIGGRHKDLMTDTFVRDLHKRMFKNVWRWAGTYRKSDNSIGVAWTQVPVQLVKLLQDTEFWIKNGTYPWPELGVRFHHRLVLVHPFPNGNGRHARLMTDILLEAHGQSIFTWGASLAQKDGLDTVGEARMEYITALKEADERKYARLIQFVQS